MTTSSILSSILPSGSVVWAYLRSSAAEDQGRSIEQQRTAIQAFCQQHGLSLERVFTDEATPAGSGNLPPQLNAMLNLVSATGARPSGVVIWDRSRLSRDLETARSSQAILEQNGVAVHLVVGIIGKNTL